MKKGWEYKTLGEVSNTVNNINWNKDEHSYLYIELTSVDRETSSIKGTTFVDKTNAPSRAKQIVKKGDVLFATTRPTLKRVAIIDDDFDNSICSTGFCVIRPQVDIVVPRLVFYLLKNEHFYKYIEPLQTGASYPAVTNNIVKLYKFAIPIDISEQRRIVSYLDSSFDYIDKIKENASKALSEAKALFQSALAEAMEPKEGTMMNKIGDVFETYAGGTPLKSHKDYYEDGNIPWLRSGEVCCKYIYETEMYITKKGMDNSSAKYYPKNTVVVAMYGATAAQVGILKIKTTSNQAVCGILPNKDFMPEYVYYWFLYIQDELAAQAQGGAQPNISQIKIKNVLIPILNLSTQKQIVSRLDSLSSKVRAIEEKYQKMIAECDAMKQAMLREVFE